jgi:hypothetical protein
MMGRQTGDQSQLFYRFNLESRIPAGSFAAPDQSGSDADIGGTTRASGALL